MLHQDESVNEDRMLLSSSSSPYAHGDNQNLKTKFLSFLARNRVFSVWTLVNTLLVIVAWLSLLILSSRINRVSNQTSNNNSVVTRAFAPGPTLTGASPLKVGDIVSLNNKGQLVRGAGISIYRFTNEFHQKKPVKHLHSITMPSKTGTGNGGGIVVCYNDDTSAYLLYGRINPVSNNIAWMNEGVSLKTLHLNQCDRFERMSDNVLVILSGKNLVPVTVTESERNKQWTATFTFGKVRQYLSSYTISPELAVLSPTSVALSYFHTTADGTSIETLVAQLSGFSENLEFSILDQVRFSDDHMSTQIMAFSPTVYVICHPNNTAPMDSGASPLSCSPISLNSNNKIVIGEAVFLDYVKMDYFFDMGLLSQNKGVVVFTDETIGNGIRAVVVELVALGDGSYTLDYGSSVIVNTGHSSGPLPTGIWTYINLEVLRENTFVVVYCDLSNDGRVTSIMVELNQASSLLLSTPEFVLSLPNPNLNKDYYWIDVSIVDPSMFIVVDSLTGPDSQGGGMVSIGEVKNGVLGVVEKIAGSKYQVSLTGVIKVTKALTPGSTYYSNSKGDMIMGGVAHSFSQENPQGYITHNSHIVSHSSVIGIAVSTNEILLNQE